MSREFRSKYQLVTIITAVVFACLYPLDGWSYVGPGAGFAFLGSTFVFVLTFFLAIATFLLWPLQWAWRKARGLGVSKAARARRVVIVGLDGLEPKLVEKYLEAGQLPNMAKLRESGGYSRLGTTLPALSPVAWSTFQTGVNPGAHNIFDFLTRDKRSCFPELASTETTPGRIKAKIGKWIWRGAPSIRITRKSKPFWKILGQRGVFSNVIRVPISYPPEKFYGNVLSAMCTPDLRGSQGTFSYFTSSFSETTASATGGQRYPLQLEKSGEWQGALVGPPDPNGNGNLTTVFFVEQPVNADSLVLRIGKSKIKLQLNVFSSWIEVEFKPKHGRAVTGICRFCLRQFAPDIELYVSPVNIHPEKPALPIAHPVLFSKWLAKRQGLYGTLGLMEDTWGRNELALDDQRFLDQTYLTHDERETMFFDALDRTREGVCVCVFDASDRIQHMFWRYLDDRHPSAREDARFAEVIPEMYRKMDALVGRVRDKLRPDDVLIVLSDHGFSSFRRGINLNTWLRNEGYLKLKDGKKIGADYLQDVDWTGTKAFAVGLSGLYINRVGREQNGIVSDSEFEALKAEISRKLEALRDPLDDSQAILKVHDTAIAYQGIYAEEAPDLVVGYNHGYRVSWDSVTGTVDAEVFSDNLKAWSGDHHIDPAHIPGILFANREIISKKPHIADIAPTVLDLFAVKAPAYMEGSVLL